MMQIIIGYLQTLAHDASGEYQANKVSTFKTLIHSTFDTDISLKSFCCFIVFSFICFSIMKNILLGCNWMPIKVYIILLTIHFGCNNFHYALVLNN